MIVYILVNTVSESEISEKV